MQKQVIDSYGKSPAGFLKYDGAYFWAGDYAECVRIKEESSWIGKYCVLDTGLTGPKTHYSKVSTFFFSNFYLGQKFNINKKIEQIRFKLDSK